MVGEDRFGYKSSTSSNDTDTANAKKDDVVETISESTEELLERTPFGSMTAPADLLQGNWEKYDYDLQLFVTDKEGECLNSGQAL